MRRFASFSGLFALLAACSDPAAPTIQDVAGSYQATVFTTRDTSGITDWLARGSSFFLTLDTAGTTTGRLFVPGGTDDGTDLDADLTGTWALDGSTVTFDHPADTFVRDIGFRFSGGRLVVDTTAFGVTLRVVLEK